MFKECTYSPSTIWRITIHIRQFSLKIHYVDFNITICPCIVYVENLMSEITKRPHNCVQIIIQLFVSRYCSPKITLKMKSIFDINISANVKKTHLRNSEGDPASCCRCWSLTRRPPLQRCWHWGLLRRQWQFSPVLKSEMITK